MSNLQAILTQTINNASHRLVDKLVDASIVVQEEPRTWEAYTARTTKRKNPLAPMRTVGAFRDNRDYGEMISNTKANHEAMTVEIDTDYAAAVYEDKPIFEEVLSAYSVRDLFIDAFQEELNAS